MLSTVAAGDSDGRKSCRVSLASLDGDLLPDIEA